MPADDDCVLPYILQKFATKRPNDVFLVFDDLEAWTYQRALDETRSLGAGLRSIGIKPQDKVLVWLPNGKLALKSWFAINSLGAVFVAINTAYRGKLLDHVVNNSEATVMIGHPDLIDRLLEPLVQTKLTVVYTHPQKVGSSAEEFRQRGIELKSWDELEGRRGDDLPIQGLNPWTTQSICYTSGTTGPSKGVLSSYLHLYTMGWECTYGVLETDRYLINLPLFHAGGTLFAYGALARGASIGVMTEFRTDTFLPETKRLGATCCILIGAMAGFLMSRPDGPDDRDHMLRLVMVLPLAEDARKLSKRFGFDVFTVFNMSEISCPIRSELNPTVRGSCGRLRVGVQARVVDPNDCEVQTGSVGELVLRSDCPWTMSHGYNAMPEATARAWRNGWFHTGDGFRVDAECNYFFVDRVKDSIRRRGENISSFEVESEVAAFPGVLEAAAVGVPNEIAEEDVLAVIATKPGVQVREEELVEFLQQRLPHFMVPRYVRKVAALPKTPTSKVEKHVLRAQGLTVDTWDREAAGLKIRRERLSD